MEESRFGAIAFKGRVFEGPYSAQIIRGLLPASPGLVLDVGCGKGAVLALIGAGGVGLDRSAASIAYARAHVPGCKFHVGDATTLIEELKLRPNLIVNIGASQAIGTPAEALAAFSAMLEPGGYLLFGDGVWDRPPSQRYLDFLGAKESDLGAFEDFKGAGETLGFTCEKAYHSTPADWDSFEDHYYETMIRWCDSHPQDPESQSFRQRMAAWRDMYLSDGRGTLGFALALFRRE